MFVLYAALVVLASLNRETGILLVACYAAFYADRWRERPAQLRLLILAGLWAGITLALHLILGPAPHVLGLAGTLQYNLNALPAALLNNAVLAPFWIAAGRAWKRSPGVLKRLALVAGAYGLTVLVGGVWFEVRLLLTAFPLVLPLLIRPKERTPDVS